MRVTACESCSTCVSALWLPAIRVGPPGFVARASSSHLRPTENQPSRGSCRTRPLARHLAPGPRNPEVDEEVQWDLPPRIILPQGSRLLGTRPPPPRALGAHLVFRGQWLLAIPTVATRAPEKFWDPQKCRSDVAFPPCCGHEPSSAIEETGTIFESTLCCVEHHGDP